MKKDLLKEAPLSPEKVISLFEEAYFYSRLFYLLKFLLKKRLFDFLKEERTLEEIAKYLDLDEKISQKILKSLEKLNLVTSFYKDNFPAYRLSTLSELYFTSDSPCSLVEYLSFYFEKIKNWEDLKSPEKVCKREKFFPKVIYRLAQECKCWELPKVVLYVSKFPEFKKAKTLLDLGGGHGLYAIAFAMSNPNLKAYVFDLPSVIKETRKFIKEYQMESRVFTIEGDFFKDNIPGSYDIIFSSYHPGGKNPEVTKKVINALNKGGLFINKQCFSQEKNLKDYLNGIDWLIFPVKNLPKGEKIYTFQGDLSLEEFINFLKSLKCEVLEVKDLSEIIGFDKEDYTKVIVAKKNA